MKLSLLTLMGALSLTTALPRHSTQWHRASTTQGFDISNHQELVDFKAAFSSGARFVLIKSTEGSSSVDPLYESHLAGARSTPLITGASHLALPDASSASEQVSFFLQTSGGWRPDNQTLPGVLDLEKNPHGSDPCYDLPPDQLISWIKEFIVGHREVTGRVPLLHTTTEWWTQCTGNARGFGREVPLVLAASAGSGGGNGTGIGPSVLPGDWEKYTIRQNSGSHGFGGGSDVFNGGVRELFQLVTGGIWWL
ncbi:glycoside hydrolase superfamily [Aspergillus karnatakaensis]|uniref:glycoside hydrolase superfamily n=1 Tax=Aspergillus karnatakaensis TaxID=1810916 RepID=UPI003CCE5197